MSLPENANEGLQGNDTWKNQQGVFLPKGYIGINETSVPLQLIKNNLSGEEFAAVKEQWKYLCCTITGANIQTGAILGLPIRVYPRYLSDEEKERQSLDTKLANQNKKENTETETENYNCHGHGHDNDFYNVYPTIKPPKIKIKSKIVKQNSNLGKIEIAIGPFISAQAYNDGAKGNPDLGIKKVSERGVIDFDQQYNACLLQLFVKTIDSYKRYVITNRLSFYINDEHARRVFPENIESQLSIMLYRTNNTYQGYSGKQKLPHDYKIIFPKILNATISELITNKNEIDATRHDQAIRTYLLVHQVSINFVIKYNHVYRYLYQSIMKWMTHPIYYKSEWPNLEEILIAITLANIKWEQIREPFIYSLINHFMLATDDMANDASMEKRIRHIFNQNFNKINKILLILSFQAGNSNSTLLELAAEYERCWGSLPKSKIDNIKQQIEQTKLCKNLADFWRMIGLAPIEMEDYLVERKIYQYIERHIQSRQQEVIVPQEIRFLIPDINTNIIDLKANNLVGNSSIIDYTKNRDDLVKQRFEEEIKKHSTGYPKLDPVTKLLSRTICGYCDRTFQSRTELFMRHIHKCMPGLRFNYHKIHNEFIIPNEHIDHKMITLAEISPGTFECPACQDHFPNENKLKEHYSKMGMSRGVDNTWDYIEEEITPEPVEEPEPTVDENSTDCVVCLTETRNKIFVPCGHLACCAECSGKLNMCPICRGRITTSIRVFYA